MPFSLGGPQKTAPLWAMHSLSVQLDKWTNFLATQKAPLPPSSCFRVPERGAWWATRRLDFCSHSPIIWALSRIAHTAQLPVEALPEPIHGEDLLLLLPSAVSGLLSPHSGCVSQALVPLVTQDIHFTEIIFFTLLCKGVSFERKRWASDTLSNPSVILEP